VDGRAGQRAIEVAERILQAMENHAWTGHPNNPMGPRELPSIARHEMRGHAA
jgi:hypothetical protein